MRLDSRARHRHSGLRCTSLPPPRRGARECPVNASTSPCRSWIPRSHAERGGVCTNLAQGLRRGARTRALAKRESALGKFSWEVSVGRSKSVDEGSRAPLGRSPAFYIPHWNHTHIHIHTPRGRGRTRARCGSGRAQLVWCNE
jgi:hypothetical protein